MVSQSRGNLKVKVYLDKAKLFALYSEGRGRIMGATEISPNII